MIELKVRDMKGFLELVDACTGKVNVVLPNGKKENINGDYMQQAQLVDRWREHGECMKVSLDVPNREDRRMLSAYAQGRG